MKNKVETLPQQPPPTPIRDEESTTRKAYQLTAAQYTPGTSPVAHAQMVQANNIGMAAGAIIGSATGENPVTGMLEGQVGANIVMQRV